MNEIVNNAATVVAICLGLAGIIMICLGIMEPDKTESFRCGVQGMLAIILSTQIQSLGRRHES